MFAGPQRAPYRWKTEGMRLFAAVLPPDDVTRELAAEVDALRRLPDADALRWTGRPGWHFTLAFYGEVDDALVPELSARLERAARRTGPFPLALRGGGQFGHGRALWTGAEGDLDTLRLLADRAEAAARRAGVPMGEHRRYKAHLTVARSRGAVDVGQYLTALDAFTSRTWTVRELVLVRSNLPKSGAPGEQPRYEAVARWPLGAAG
jgi:2'-5' RNA ligase